MTVCSCIRRDHNGPFLIKSTPLFPVKQAFSPPKIQERRIQYNSKAIHHIEYDASCGGAEFRRIDCDGEHIQEETNQEHQKPDEWNWLVFWATPLEINPKVMMTDRNDSGADVLLGFW